VGAKSELSTIEWGSTPHGESVLMVVERVGAFLYDALQQYDGKTIVVIGHRATRYGLEYWCGEDTLEEIVRRPWKWRALPIWRYELTTHTLSGGQDHIPKSVHGRGL
jgi:hypothetical protein